MNQVNLKNLSQKELIRIFILKKKTKQELIDLIKTKDDFFEMNQSILQDSTKNELIEIILLQNKSHDEIMEIIDEPKKDVIKPSTEENIIKPSTEEKIIKPHTEENIIKPHTEENITNTAQMTRIKETDKALKGYTKSYEIGINNNKNPLEQLQNTRLAVKHHINTLLNEIKGLKFVETLKVTFRKVSNNEIIDKNAYFNSKTQTIINDLDIPESLNLSEQQILNFIALWVSEGSGWTIESVENHYLNIVKYKPMNGSSYIQLPEELRNSAKGLINLKNNDNRCFLWCHIRYLNPTTKDPQRIKKSDKQYVNNLNYNDIEFPLSTKYYNKIEKQNEININVFGYEDKQKYPIYVSKEKYDNCMNLLLITKDENKHYVLIKDFNKFMYNQTKHKERKHFCMHCLQCFSSELLLNNHKLNCIQVNGVQAMKMPTKDNNILKFENFHKQQQVPFVIYADFESILETAGLKYRSQVTGYRSQVTGYRSQVTGYRSQVTGHRSQVTGYRSQVTGQKNNI